MSKSQDGVGGTTTNFKNLGDTEWGGDLLVLSFNNEDDLVHKEKYERSCYEVGMGSSSKTVITDSEDNVRVLFYAWDSTNKFKPMKPMENLYLKIIEINKTDHSITKKKVIDYSSKGDKFEYVLSLGAALNLGGSSIVYGFEQKGGDRLFRINY